MVLCGLKRLYVVQDSLLLVLFSSWTLAYPGGDGEREAGGTWQVLWRKMEASIHPTCTG